MKNKMRFVLVLISLFMFLLFSQNVFAENEIYFSDTATMKELAEKNSIPLKKLRHEIEEQFKIEQVSGMTRALDINLNKKAFETIYEEIDAGFSLLIMLGMGFWILIGVFYLYLLKYGKVTDKIKYIVFIFVIIYFGLILHGQPNPMEALSKFFKATAGKDTWNLKIFYISFFTIFALVGTHFFCSIACQIGSIQDFLFLIAKKIRIKRRKLPFLLTNGVRGSLFVLFILFLYEILSGFELTTMYHHVNLFKIYNLNLSSIGWVTFTIVVLFSFVFYRPFCSFICPFGFLSWLVSHISLFKIKIDFAKCAHCQACVDACPNHSMHNIYNKRNINADCFSCGKCINVCPQKCIEYACLPIKRSGTGSKV